DARGWLPGGELAYLHNGRRRSSNMVRGSACRLSDSPSTATGTVTTEVELGMVAAPVGVPRGESVNTITVAATRGSAGGKGRKTTVNNRTEHSQRERIERRPEGTSRAAERRDRSERQTTAPMTGNTASLAESCCPIADAPLPLVPAANLAWRSDPG